MSAFNNILVKLEDFLRKYYKHRLIKGSLYTLGSLCIAFLVLNISEYTWYFQPIIKTCLFFGFLAIAVFFIVKYILQPALGLFKIRRDFTHEDAARVIGNHFPNVQDKLLNLLQLTRLEPNSQSSSLLMAAIEQKSLELSPIPFQSIIQFKTNRKYLWFALPPLILLFVLLFAAPQFISKSSARLIDFSQAYEKPAPFNMLVLNKTLEVVQGDDLLLEVQTEGDPLPAEMFLVKGSSRILMKKSSNTSFSYNLQNLQSNLTFQLSASGYSSNKYKVLVLPKPSLNEFTVTANYPNYTKIPNASFENLNDISVPVGTKLTWNIQTANVSEMELAIDSVSKNIVPDNLGAIEFFERIMRNSSFQLFPKNSKVKNSPASVQFSIEAIPDLFPTIDIIEKSDSIQLLNLYFSGKIEDDYGFSSLWFCYRKESQKTKSEYTKTPLPLDKNSLIFDFFHYVNISDLGFVPGDELSYYFEVRDNDGVTGPKASKSEVRTKKIASKEELKELVEKDGENIKKQLEKSLEEARKLQEEITHLNEKLKGKTELSFSDKQQIEQLIKKQESLQSQMSDIVKKNKDKNIKSNDINSSSERILEKQKELDRLFNEMLDEDTKEKIKELQELLEKEELKPDKLDDIKLGNKELEQELDRMLSLYKQLEMEEKLDQLAEELKEMSEEQKKIKEETQNNKEIKPETKQKQEELNKKFDELKKDIDKLEKLNEEAETDVPTDELEKESKDIQDEMNKAGEEMNQGKPGPASESQQKAEDAMAKMSQKMAEMAGGMSAKQLNVSIRALREILENLIAVSFEQERIINEMRRVRSTDPKYVQLTKDQKKLKDDMSVVGDSLASLAKKVIEIESFISKEMIKVEGDMADITQLMADRNIGNAASKQQYVLTSVNNLALLLSEVLDNLQAQMMASAKGSGKSGGKDSKPGKGKGPSMSNLRQMQEQLNKDLSNFKGAQEGGSGNPAKSSEQLAKMAAQQQAIRNALQEINKEQNKDGKGGLGDLDQLKREMQETEKDIVNKQLNTETIKRQKEILTRLLEAEKAEKERETDSQRESKQGKEQAVPFQALFKEYESLQNKEQLEQIRSNNPELNNFYRQKTGEYYKNLNKAY